MEETDLKCKKNVAGIYIRVSTEDQAREGWIVNPFLYNFYKDTFLYSTGVK